MFFSDPLRRVTRLAGGDGVLLDGRRHHHPDFDKPSFLRMAGVPSELTGTDGKALRLVDVELRYAYQVGTASPAFNAAELVYLPFPASMVRERATMVFVYVSLSERRDVDLGEMVKLLKRREQGAEH